VDLPWLDSRVPNGYWETRENRVKYLDWLGQQLGFQSLSDWYQLSNSHFMSNSGGTLLQRFYGSSALSAMEDYRPEVDWMPWRFAKTPKGFWLELNNRRTYLKWLGEKLEFECEEDWYQLSKTSFLNYYGSGLLRNFYQGSILSAMYEIYPEYDWKPWLMSKVPRGFWNFPKNRMRYAVWLVEKLKLTSTADLHSLSQQDFRDHNGAGLLCDFYRGSLSRFQDDLGSMSFSDPLEAVSEVNV